MKRTQEIEIDGSRYSVGQYSATKAVRLLAKLAKIIGKPIGILTAAGQNSEVTPDLLGSAIESLTSSLDPDDFVATVKEVLEGVHVFEEKGNRPVNFDADFTGRIGHMMKLVRRVLEFQFEDFFGDLAANMGGVLSVRSKVQAK